MEAPLMHEIKVNFDGTFSMNRNSNGMVLLLEAMIEMSF